MLLGLPKDCTKSEYESRWAEVVPPLLEEDSHEALSLRFNLNLDREITRRVASLRREFAKRHQLSDEDEATRLWNRLMFLNIPAHEHYSLGGRGGWHDGLHKALKPLESLDELTTPRTRREILENSRRVIAGAWHVLAAALRGASKDLSARLEAEGIEGDPNPSRVLTMASEGKKAVQDQWLLPEIRYLVAGCDVVLSTRPDVAELVALSKDFSKLEFGS